VGRRKKPIDPAQVVKLGRLGCTQEEIADILGCSADTLQRRFAAELARARGLRKMSLRKAQTIRAIRDRSDTMLIHLGRTELGQVIGRDAGTLREILADLLALDSGPDPGGAGEVPR
jgi:AraC-like DNA-binding protein